MERRRVGDLDAAGLVSVRREEGDALQRVQLRYMPLDRRDVVDVDVAVAVGVAEKRLVKVFTGKRVILCVSVRRGAVEAANGHVRTVPKRVVRDALAGAWHGDRQQPAALRKGVCADGGDGVGQDDRLYAAAHPHIITDSGHRISEHLLGHREVAVGYGAVDDDRGFAFGFLKGIDAVAEVGRGKRRLHLQNQHR